MRKAINVGTKHKPIWTGQVRYEGRQHYVGRFKSAKEWENAAHKLLAELKAEKEPAARSMTVKEFVGTKKEPGLWMFGDKRKQSTKNVHIENIQPFVRDYGDLTFEELPPAAALRQWMAKGKDGGPQSKNAIKAARLLFNLARTNHVTNRPNPFESPGIEEGKGRGGDNIMVLEDDEVELLAECARSTRPGLLGDSLYALMIWQAYTAVRPGESFEMTEDHLRLDDKRAWVPGTKTVNAPRWIMVPGRAVEAMREMPRRSAERLWVTSRCHPFKSGSGMNYYWAPIRDKFHAALGAEHQLNVRVQEALDAGLDPYNSVEGQGYFQMYELRHFGLTRLLKLGGWNNGMDVAIQAGHGNPELLWSTYGHPNKEESLGRLDALDEMSRMDDEDLHRFAAGG